MTRKKYNGGGEVTANGNQASRWLTPRIGTIPRYAATVFSDRSGEAPWTDGKRFITRRFRNARLYVPTPEPSRASAATPASALTRLHGVNMLRALRAQCISQEWRGCTGMATPRPKDEVLFRNAALTPHSAQLTLRRRASVRRRGVTSSLFPGTGWKRPY